jgi:hypothetical protein
VFSNFNAIHEKVRALQMIVRARGDTPDNLSRNEEAVLSWRAGKIWEVLDSNATIKNADGPPLVDVARQFDP